MPRRCAHDWLKRVTKAARLLAECGRKLTSGQLVDLAVTVKVHEGFYCHYSRLSPAPLSNDLVVFTPDTLPILADVREQCRFLLFEHRSDIPH